MAKERTGATEAPAANGTKRTRATRPKDTETEAIAAVTAALQPLGAPARERVMNYVNSRLAETATQ